MKINRYSGILSLAILSGITISSFITSTNAYAATLSGGSLTINLDRDALIAGTLLETYPDTPTSTFQICCRPSIYVEEFFDASSANTKTFSQIQNDNTPDLFDLQSDEISAQGLQFTVNGYTNTPNPLGRANQNSSFTFDSNNFFNTASGAIGLNGVIRFRVDVEPPKNRILLGDLTLQYDPALEGSTPGRSGWKITNHIGFNAGAFDLYDVTTSLTNDDLNVSGSLGFGDGFDHLGASSARFNQTRIGTFNFQASLVPEPLSAWMFLSGLTGLFINYRSKRFSTV